MQNQKFERMSSMDCYILVIPSSLTRNGPANIQPMISPRDHKSMDFGGGTARNGIPCVSIIYF